VLALTEFSPDACPDAAVCGDTSPNSWAGILAANDVQQDLLWLYWLVLVSIFVGFRVVALLILSWKAAHFET